jgi:hypothetical protein
LAMRIVLASIFGVLSGFFWIFFSGRDAHIQLELSFCWIGAAAGVTFIAYSSAGRSLRWMSIVALCAAALTYGGVLLLTRSVYTATHQNTCGYGIYPLAQPTLSHPSERRTVYRK